ncbi:16S rRNA (cytidine1402-2'-O)-methyltransferase [Salinihabitans flavidus]|uniref:Ribosomal RNA small subunit methyltransferase I n=1 Tax=Salinihabitans flavidus TaxID=569882 RepID=A0A1H8LD23_9RHOB|nr:16S rRNA (cytidine(1402)-2'-O)-methyltransferase [Salinihabitans flavidus]SEO02973.1 16S rRNA (cytidine1402-2'-O)-methyltransferase [Salinihabitans flavidus]
MNYQQISISPGLYFVATPIGTARDITLRALDILASADAIAAEDTRSMRRLLDIHGVPLGDRPLISYHDHSGPRARAGLLKTLSEGRSVAYASEAGTPLIADPGYALAREAAEAGYAVTAAPGPSAVITALVLAGLPTDAFFFGGFLPNASGARRKTLQSLREVPGTLVFYESPRRVAAMLEDAADMLGEAREAVICRELTKKFEEIRRGTLAGLAAELAGRALRGEVVVVIDRARTEGASSEEVEEALRHALESMSLRDAADSVGKAMGQNKRKIYQLALKIKEETGKDE